MTLNSPEVKQILAAFEQELRELTGNDAVLITTFVFANEKRTWEEVLRACEFATGITKEEILGRNRDKPIALARQLTAFFSMQYTGMSSKRIGLKFFQDHTTVLQNAREIKNKLWSGDTAVCKAVVSINEILFPESKTDIHGQQ